MSEGWTVSLTSGLAVPGPYNRLDKVPAYLDEFVRDSNQDAKDIAVEAATKAMKPKSKASLED